MKSPEERSAYMKIWRAKRRPVKATEPDLPGEIWKAYPGHDGFFTDYYEVSTCGRIKSLPREVEFNDPKRPNYKTMIQFGKIMKQANHHGYLGVVLSKEGVRKQVTVGRLVAETFIPNPDNKEQVNHKDGNKHNNHVSNLEWSTAQENTSHGRQVLGRCVGELNGRAKLNPEKVREIRKLGETLSVLKIARLFGMSEGAINPILNGEHWKSVT